MELSKHFYQLLLSALHSPTFDAVNNLESAWKLQRPRFINLLKHASKSASDRQTVHSAASAPGIRFSDVSSVVTPASPRQGFVVLQQTFVDEALLVSDAFDLNELEALKLVLVADGERANQPDWPRGLCAVYLFYKNRWYQAESLKMLMRNRQGRCWRHDVPSGAANEAFVRLQHLIDTITDQLWKDDLLNNLLGVLQSPVEMIKLEFDRLQQPKVRGLGGARHRKMISDCIRETCTALGDALYYWCCQTPLDPQEFSCLLKFISENSGKGGLLPVTFAALQAIDVSVLESSDSEEEISSYASFASDRSILLAFNSAITDDRQWTDLGAQSLIQLAWAVSLRMIARHHLTQATLEESMLSLDEEDLLNNALALPGIGATKENDIRGPFHWIRRNVLSAPEFLADQLYVARLHSLITELIVCFPLKMKEWRSESDEECRRIAEMTVSGMDLDTAPPLHFEQFMLMIGEFYGTSAHSQLGLSEAYFCPMAHQEAVTTGRRIPQAQMALFKFLRTSGEMLPSRLYIAYLRMLAGLASNETSARLCFEMLQSFGTLGASLSAVSIDNFFAALDRYLLVLRSIRPSSSAGAAPNSPLILPDEMKGLQAWFDVVTSMANQDDSIRFALFEHPRWSCPANMIGLLTCAVPLELKAHALRCLEALAKSPEQALALSEALLVSSVIPSVSGSKSVGIQYELEEVEARLETYPVAAGLVKFLAALFQHKSFTPDGPSMTPYVNFVLNSVLVHLMNRNYQSPSELWSLASAVLRFIHVVIENYEPTVANVVGQSVGCQVMAALMNDGPIFRTLCHICISSVQWLDEYSEDIDMTKLVLEASLYSLKVFYAVLSKQDAFGVSVIESGAPLMTTSMDTLLQMLNPQTNEADYVISFAMFLKHYHQIPEHCLYAVRVIDALNTSITNQAKLVKYFAADKIIASRILHGFVSCLSMDNIDASLDMSDTEKETQSEPRIRAHAALAVLELMISDVKRGGSLSNFLGGFNLRHPTDTKLENAGVDDTPRTCLHAVLDITEASLGEQLQSLSFGALVEPAYRLLFWFAASPKTADPTLRYLRTEYEFFPKNIVKLKLPEESHKSRSMKEPSSETLAMAEIAGWLLKLCALELASISDTQPHYAMELAKLLIAEEMEYGAVSMDVGIGAGSSFSSVREKSRRGIRGEKKTGIARRLFEFLAAFNSVASSSIDETVVVPRLQHFEGVRLSKIVGSCTTRTAKDYYKCDVARLADVLEQELLSLQGTTASAQLHLVRQEIQNVLSSLTRYNGIQYAAYVFRQGFAGLSQISQLLFSVCSLEWLEPEQLDQMIIETMIEALRSSVSVVADEMAGLLLTLTTILRRRFRIDAPIEKRSIDTTHTFRSDVLLLDGSMARMGQKHNLACAGLLATALKLLVEAILKPENRRENVKHALYGALINFFRLWQEPVDSGLSDDVRTKSLEPTVRERMAEEHWIIVSHYVVDLVDVLAKDSANGSAVTKTVSMCCLVTLLQLDAVHGGAGRKAFVNRGYINAIRFPAQFQKWVTILIS